VRKLEPIRLKPWTLPLIIAAVAVPIIAAFMFGGPGAGLAVGALAAAAILVIAARARFDEPIEVGASPGDRYMLLVVAIGVVGDPGLAGAVAAIAAEGARATGAGAAGDAEVQVKAPALNTAVAHWLSDLRQARLDAQRRLAVSLGSLAAADLDARGEVGDSDPVQAVEDTLRSFPAQEVVFVTPSDHDREVEEVRRRLDRPVRVLATTAAAGERSA
jgi:hypothetical protein